MKPERIDQWMTKYIFWLLICIYFDRVRVGFLRGKMKGINRYLLVLFSFVVMISIILTMICKELSSQQDPHVQYRNGIVGQCNWNNPSWTDGHEKNWLTKRLVVVGLALKEMKEKERRSNSFSVRYVSTVYLENVKSFHHTSFIHSSNNSDRKIQQREIRWRHNVIYITRKRRRRRKAFRILQLSLINVVYANLHDFHCLCHQSMND